MCFHTVRICLRLRRQCTVLLNLAFLSTLGGCAGTPHGADLESLRLVLRGEATAKERILFFERTSYEVLLEHRAYFARWYGGACAPIRESKGDSSVRRVINDVAGKGGERKRFFFLVRGIGTNERIFQGHAEEEQADSLRVVPGDLLIIDPPTDHFLFGLTAGPGHSER